MAPGSANGRAVPIPLDRVPGWVLVLVAAGLVVAARLAGSAVYRETLRFLASGVVTTLSLTVASFAVALVAGLVAALLRLSPSPFLRTPAVLYVEVVRGIPLLVLLLYIAFVVTPWLADVTGMRWWRDNVVRAVLGLGMGYGAYLAEVYRAGIEAVPRGQVEAALSLGMSRAQTLRHVVLPQAVRTVLPPLGNDFVALLKDSSLASVISVTELTYSGNLNVARTFRSFETYNAVALLYLCMTLVGSAGVRLLERVTRTPGWGGFSP